MGNLRNIRVSFWKADYLTVKLLSYTDQGKKQQQIESALDLWLPHQIQMRLNTGGICLEFHFAIKDQRVSVRCPQCRNLRSWGRDWYTYDRVCMTCQFPHYPLPASIIFNFYAVLLYTPYFCLFPSNYSAFQLCKKKKDLLCQRAVEHTNIVLSLFISSWNRGSDWTFLEQSTHNSNNNIPSNIFYFPSQCVLGLGFFVC